MKLFRYLLLGVGVLFLVAGIALGVAWVATMPSGPEEGTQSAARLAPGPHLVSTYDFDWVDTSRPTAPNGDFEGAPERRLTTTLWVPVGRPASEDGTRPLVIYAHGFYSARTGGAYIAEHLASHGYVVAAPTFPLSNGSAPGGPIFQDIVNQPADVSFVIDKVLALTGEQKPFEGTIDPEKIGIVGLSLGGGTVTLTAFHPEWKDERIAAAISIAGMGDVFGSGFFDNADVPFLMIAGTADGLINYDLNAKPIPGRSGNNSLLSIENASHGGFDHATAGITRIFGNPDKFGCLMLGSSDDPTNPENNSFAGLFGPEDYGLLRPEAYRGPCSVKFDNVLKAGRQQMIATLAVHAYFEGHFASDPAERKAHMEFLSKTLSQDFPEVSYETGTDG